MGNKHWPFPVVCGKIPESNKPKEQSMQAIESPATATVDSILQLMEENYIYLFRHLSIPQGKHVIISQSKLLELKEGADSYCGMTLQEVYEAVEHEIQVRETIA